jgi:hypothetical protein
VRAEGVGPRVEPGDLCGQLLGWLHGTVGDVPGTGLRPFDPDQANVPVRRPYFWGKLEHLRRGVEAFFSCGVVLRDPDRRRT